MVKLVDHDVVERITGELAEVPDARERLDGGEEDIGLRNFLVAGEEPQPRLGADPAEGGERLPEDLLAVRDEEDARKLRLRAVEGGEPGLPEARGEDDEPGTIALGPRPAERLESLALDGVRLEWRQGLRRHTSVGSAWIVRRRRRYCSIQPGVRGTVRGW